MFLAPVVAAEEAVLAYADSHVTSGHLGVRVSIRDGIVYVSARGTANVQNWLLDLKAEKVRVTLCGHAVTLEKGFAEAWNIIRLPILEYLVKYRAWKIVLSAHSLGCPIVRQMGGELVDAGFNVVAALCLESPMTGGDDFESWYTSKAIPTTYVRHGEDCVPVVPGTRFGYVFPGNDAQTLILDNYGNRLKAQPLAAEFNLVERAVDTCRDHDVGAVLRAYRLYCEGVARANKA